MRSMRAGYDAGLAPKVAGSGKEPSRLLARHLITSPGAYATKAPGDAGRYVVYLLSGGAGGGAYYNGGSTYAGGGGGGGGTATRSGPCLPNQTITGVVGDGGFAGSSNQPGGDGGNTTAVLDGVTVCQVAGGKRGEVTGTSYAAQGGLGGRSTEDIGGSGGSGGDGGFAGEPPEGGEPGGCGGNPSGNPGISGDRGGGGGGAARWGTRNQFTGIPTDAGDGGRGGGENTASAAAGKAGAAVIEYWSA